ncbi:type II secretion system secretin GspD [Caulobacter sp. KR2-114]|uniref:type II secretion system secretin GspD n=1 Tax=Caulobacter sp. KR2-114 TaxID=3400912 RepID=UPI003C0084EB
MAASHASSSAQSYTFAFQDADVTQVAEAILGQALGVTYSVDPSVTGKMTFRIDRRLTREQLLEAFEAVLNTNNIAMVRQGDALFLTPRDKAKGAAPMRTLAEGVHHAGYETLAVPLSYATPSEVAKALGSISTTNLVVYVDDKAGLLVLGGTGEELEAAVKTIHVFDHSGLESAKIRWFELSQAPAQTVADELDKVLQASGAGNVTVVPLRRLNGVFVFARTPQALDQVADWVGKLDVPAKEQASTLYVYHPKNASAEKLAQALGTFLGLQGASSQGGASAPLSSSASPSIPGPPIGAVNSGPLAQMTSMTAATAPAPVSSGSSSPISMSGSSTDGETLKIGVDRESNSLLVQASAGRWMQIQKILDEIDKAPPQVLIEASIVEVTLTNDFRFGIDWSSLSSGGKLQVASIESNAGTVGPQFPGFSVTFLDKNIMAALNTLGSKSAVEVVSAPKIVALDNHTAKLQVGDQVPVVTQSSQATTAPNSPIVSSVDYRSTGVILSVTPRVTGDDRIFLDITQEVSAVSNTTTSGIDSPTISQRHLESSLIMNNGAVVALGGLISTGHTVSDSGVPYLKDTPVVGNLFKSSKKNGNRTELIVLLTASILKDQASTNQVMTRLEADMREIEARGLLSPP